MNLKSCFWAGILSCLFVGALSAQTTRIVCIGNSISQGKENRGIYHNTSIGDSLAEMSYRFWLWEKLDSAEFDIEFVGFYNKYFTETDPPVSISRYTDHTFLPSHESYYGIETGGFITGGWSHYPGGLPDFDTRLESYMPDVALIHLGTNDEDEDVQESEANLKTIIAKLRGKNPNVTILLARLMTDWKHISKEMPRIADELTNSRSVVYCVDMATGFVNDSDKPNTMTHDWVHPNRIGQLFMAKRWYEAYVLVVGEDIEDPQTPHDVELSNVTTTSADISWTAATDNKGINVYRLYLDGDSLLETPATSIELTNLDFSTEPELEIMAVDYWGNESPLSQAVVINPESSMTEHESWQCTRFYPNPADNLLNIRAATMGQTVTILDLQGRRLLSQKVDQHSFTLDISHLPAGLYILQSTDRQHSYQQKLIIE